jgi:hypothetical protein
MRLDVRVLDRSLGIHQPRHDPITIDVDVLVAADDHRHSDGRGGVFEGLDRERVAARVDGDRALRPDDKIELVVVELLRQRDVACEDVLLFLPCGPGPPLGHVSLDDGDPHGLAGGGVGR